MQPLLCDVFRELVIKTRQNNLWEQATPEQIERLVSRYLLHHYSTSERSHILPVSSFLSLWASPALTKVS